MKKLLLFLFVVCAVFAGAWNNAYWEYHNPYIYHFLNIEVWDTEIMHQSLSSLELENITLSAVTDDTAKTNLQDAVSNMNKAKTSKQACETLYAKIVNSLPSDILAAGIINPNYLILKISWFMATDMISTTSECANYGEHWKATMDSTESALIISKKRLDEQTTIANKLFEEAKNSGICDDDFTGESKELCKNAEFDYGALNGKYVPDLNYYYDYFVVQSEENMPNMTGYADLMNNIFNNAMPAANNLESASNEALEKANEEYGFLKLNAEQKMKEAKQKLNNLDNEQLVLIKDSTYSEESKGTIETQYTKLKEKTADADSAYVTAVFSSSATTQGHMKESIVLMTNSYVAYDLTVNESEILLADAKKVVNAQKEDALNEMAEFEQKTSGGTVSTAAKSLYDSAQGNFAKGEDAERIGNQFRYYLLSAADARKAITKLGQTPAELETTVTAEFKKTQELLANAKKDGVDIYLEEEELKLLSGIKEDWIIDELANIQGGVLERTQIKYEYLESKRTDLLKKISLSGGKLDDLLVEMKKVEKNAFEGTTLDVATGLGNLAEIAKEYAYMEGEIEKEMKTIVENGLNKELTLNIDAVELDMPANISAYLFIANPYGFGAKEIAVKVKIPVELKENEIIQGAEFVDSATYVSGTLNLQINEVMPYDQILVTFNKQAIIATVLKKEKTIVGNPDGNADVRERIEFETSYDSNSVYVPEEFKDWTIDGKTGFGRKTGRIVKGSHVLEGIYKINDAFVTTKTDFKAIKAGLNSEVSYDLTIMPESDLDSAYVIVNEESSDRISGFSVLSYGGAEVKSKKSLGNNIYSVELKELKLGENVTLRISYTVEGSKEYAIEEIAFLKNKNWSENTNMMLDSAQEALDGNDTRRAIEYVEKAKSQIEKEKLDSASENSKLKEEKELVEVQGEEINAAIKIAIENNATQTQTYYQLETRKNEINEALMVKTSAGLSGFDSAWAKKKAVAIKKYVFESYNTLKQQYLEVNNGIANQTEFIEFENAFSKLEATGKLEDAVLVEAKLKYVEALVAKKTSVTKEEQEALFVEAELLKGETDELVGVYAKEYDAAKGSAVSALFGPDYKTVQKELTALENLVSKGANAGQITEKISSVKKLKASVSETLSYLKQEAGRKLDSLKGIYTSKKDGLSESDRSLASQGLVKMEEQYNKGNYADSLIAGDAVTKIMQKENETSINGTIILGITALLLIGAVIIYLVKGGKRSGRNRQTTRLRSMDDL